MVLILASLLSLAPVAITFNTIRLQIPTQREEIEVAKLIGATKGSIHHVHVFRCDAAEQSLHRGLADALLSLLLNGQLGALAELCASHLVLLVFSMHLGWLGGVAVGGEAFIMDSAALISDGMRLKVIQIFRSGNLQKACDEMNARDQIKRSHPPSSRNTRIAGNTKAVIQCLNTLIPYFVLFYLAMNSLATSFWLAAAYIFASVSFHRAHFHVDARFRSSQFVSNQEVEHHQWIFHRRVCRDAAVCMVTAHNHHHATNGNWEKYRGPLNVLSVNEYENCHPESKDVSLYEACLDVPVGALMYFIFNPRFTGWWAAEISLGVLGKKLKSPRTPLKTLIAGQESRQWNLAGSIGI